MLLGGRDGVICHAHFFVRRSSMNLNEIIREIMKLEPLVKRAGGLL